MPKESKEYFAQRKEPEEEKLSPEKLEIQGRLQTLIRSISDKPNLEVTTKVDPRTLMSMAAEGKDANQEWYRMTQHDPKTKKVIKEFVHIPGQIFETNENVAKGKAAHEAGHVVVTRMAEFIPDKVMQELGFHAVISAIEERPTDQVVRERYPGAGDWVDEARQDNVKRALIMSKSKEKLGYIPKFAQLCDMMVHEAHYKEMPPYFDPEITKLYDKIKKHVGSVEKTLPTEGAKEQEVLEKAKERYKITYSKIWPEAKKLVEKDVNQEALKQMIAGEKELMEKLAEALREELMAALAQPLKQQKEKKEKAEQEEKTAGEKEGADKGMPKEAAKEAPEKEAPPIPMDKLSPELQKALKENFDKLSKEKQEALKEAAKQNLEKLEDELVKEFSGKLEEQPAETHAEHKKQMQEKAKRESAEKQKEAEKSAEEEKIKKELEEIERRQAGLKEQAGVYEATYQEIRELDEVLYQRLETIFSPNIKERVKLKASGAKINLPAVFKWEAGREAGGKSVESRIFESVEIPEKKDYAITMVVDLSGSMQGVRIHETFKGVVLLSEVLNRLGVKNEVLGFSNNVWKFKDINEDLNDVIRNRMSSD